jgi:hypothetical protein
MKLAVRVDVSGVIQVCLALVLLGGISCFCAQQTDQTARMDHGKPAVPSTQLSIRGLDGKSITLAPADIAALPHKTVSVYNEHTKANETYSGVALVELLKEVNTPSGEAVRCKVFMT